MKKLLIATSLLTLTTTSVFADTSGTLLLKGTVGRVLSIAVTAEGAADALDLSTSQSDLKVAEVNEQSNVVAGYNVKITSANEGKLKRTGGSEVFSYTMTYDNLPVSLTGVTTGTTFTTAASSAGVNVDKDVKISYTGVPAVSMIEGEYVDTVTFEIASN